MSAISSPATSPAAPRRRRRGGERRSPPAPVHTLGNGASPEAGRRAAAILEVLAGQRTPREVAQALGVSLPYFYLLERKALGG